MTIKDARKIKIKKKNCDDLLPCVPWPPDPKPCPRCPRELGADNNSEPVATGAAWSGTVSVTGRTRPNPNRASAAGTAIPERCTSSTGRWTAGRTNIEKIVKKKKKMYYFPSGGRAVRIYFRVDYIGSLQNGVGQRQTQIGVYFF